MLFRQKALAPAHIVTSESTQFLKLKLVAAHCIGVVESSNRIAGNYKCLRAVKLLGTCLIDPVFEVAAGCGTLVAEHGGSFCFPRQALHSRMPVPVPVPACGQWLLRLALSSHFPERASSHGLSLIGLLERS